MMMVIDKYGRVRHEPDNYVLKDGEGTRVPVFAMDSVQRAMTGWARPARTPLRDERVAALAERNAFYQSAHLGPTAPSPTTPRPTLTGDAAKEAAWQEKCRWLADAHKPEIEKLAPAAITQAGGGIRHAGPDTGETAKLSEAKRRKERALAERDEYLRNAWRHA